MTTRGFGATLVGVMLVAGGCTGSDQGEESSVGPVSRSDDVVLAWFELTARAVQVLDAPVQSPSSAVWASAWLAGDRALDRWGDGDTAHAVVAFAQALHDVLVTEVPAAQDVADAQLAFTLDSVEAGQGREDAARVGADAAAAVVAERDDDGLAVSEVADDYTPHGGAGYWVTTTPDASPNQVALGRATPFLAGPDLPTAPVPPALGTEAYRVDLAEDHDLGAAEGSTRTDQQTEVARFWEQSSLAAYTQVLRDLLVHLSDRPLAERVHLVAVFHETTTDAQIACFAAKYTYERWRPLTAIHEADLDGNPLSDGDPQTVPDPEWEPLLRTPLHPEYPSAHTVYAGAAAEVLQRLVGPPPRSIDLDSSTAPGVTRSYVTWDQLVEENIDARVWGGIHFRASDEYGAELGREVARQALAGLDDDRKDRQR